MLISWKHNFLFIHIAKTGGTALTQALAPYSRLEDRFAYVGGATPILRHGFTFFFGGAKYIENITGFDAHSSFRNLQRAMGEDKLAPLTKVAFIRNPFTRTVSLYLHIKRDAQHVDHKALRDLTFEEALPLMAENDWITQTKYLFQLGAKKIAMDFIGSFERIEEDSEALARILALPAPLRLKHLNVNPGPAPDLKEMFGAQLAPFIAAHEEEFELLGYSPDIDRAAEPPKERGSMN